MTVVQERNLEALCREFAARNGVKLVENPVDDIFDVLKAHFKHQTEKRRFSGRSTNGIAIAYVDYNNANLSHDKDEAMIVRTNDYLILVERKHQRGEIYIVDRKTGLLTDLLSNSKVKDSIGILREYDTWGSYFDKAVGIDSGGYAFYGLTRNFEGVRQFLRSMMD